MRLIMLGTGPFAVPTLRALAHSRHEVTQVVTRPPQGRTRAASPVELAAQQLGLPVWSPATVNALESQARLAAIEADLLVVCDYGEILRPETLAVTRLGGINLHGSLLPKYRGAAPVQWAILCGEQETGNSVIHMTAGLDAGPVLAQQRIVIDPEEDAAQLEARLAAMGPPLVLDTIDSLEAGSTKPISQVNTQMTKAPRLKKTQGAIDWARTAHEIKNQVRALRPWPRAYSFWHRDSGDPLRLSIDRVAVLTSPSTKPPGTVVVATDQLLIDTGDSPLEILEVQPAGKRSMTAGEFLRGYRVRLGDRFAESP